MTKLTDNLEVARHILLEPAGLGDTELQRVLSNLLGHTVDQADLYFQSAQHESWTLEDGIIKEGGYSIDYGVGVRAISGEKTGFAYSDEIILPALEEAAFAARSIANQGGHHRIQAWHKQSLPTVLYQPDDPLKSISDADKINLLRRVDAEARKSDPRIKQVIVSMAGSYEIILVVGSDGTFSADIRPLVRLNVSVIAEENGRREQGSSGGGGENRV